MFKNNRTMKKAYINPSMEVISIATQQMLALSVGIDEQRIDPNSAAGREFDFDDEEDSF